MSILMTRVTQRARNGGRKEKVRKRGRAGDGESEKTPEILIRVERARKRRSCEKLWIRSNGTCIEQKLRSMGEKWDSEDFRQGLTDDLQVCMLIS